MDGTRCGCRADGARSSFAGEKQQRFVAALLKLIRRLERFSRPRLRLLFRQRFTGIVFGLMVIGGSAGAFFAPPFSGLDTLPALGVVLLSLGVLLEDFALAVAGILVGVTGVALEDRPRCRSHSRPADDPPARS